MATAGGGVRWRKAYNHETVRMAVAEPRRIPRRSREEITAILAQEIISSRHVEDRRRHAARWGGFHLILGALKETAEWPEIRKLTAKSDVTSTLALRAIAVTVFDVLDRSQPIPGDSTALQSLGGLMALSVMSWRKDSPLRRQDILRAIGELEASDVSGEARSALVEVLNQRLVPVTVELQACLSMMSKLEQLLPTGVDEATVEEVFLSYLQDIDRMAELLRRSKELEQIIDLMGQLDIEYGVKGERVSGLATSESYSLVRSSDIRHLLPVELIKLKVPILRTLFFSQMIEGELLTYELQGNWSAQPRKHRGPVIALVDASGSMSGYPEIIAKALILMLVRRMAREGRKIRVILFADVDWSCEVDLSDKTKLAKSLLEILGREFVGGTDFNTALHVGLDTVHGEQWKGADILLFTDGMSEVSNEELVKAWNTFKKKSGSRIFTLIVGNTTSGGLDKVSDEIYLLPTDNWDVEGSPSHIVKLIAAG